MNTPYIGITDFMTFEQVMHMLSVWKNHLKKGQNRRLHVGVMMSHKTLNGIETKWSKAFPAKEDIGRIFSSTETMNCLHYADYQGIDVSHNLARAIQYGGKGINAIQLDMIWPKPAEISEAIRISEKKLEIILQINRVALEQVFNRPDELTRRLNEYNGLIQYILMDMSAGQGISMDASLLLPYIRMIKDFLPRLDISVAGGLGPDSIYLVTPIVKEFPDVSIDAQGKLRPSGNALEPVDWEIAGNYLIEALKVLE